MYTPQLQQKFDALIDLLHQLTLTFNQETDLITQHLQEGNFWHSSPERTYLFDQKERLSNRLTAFDAAAYKEFSQHLPEPQKNSLSTTLAALNDACQNNHGVLKGVHLISQRMLQSLQEDRHVKNTSLVYTPGAKISTSAPQSLGYSGQKSSAVVGSSSPQLNMTL